MGSWVCTRLCCRCGGAGCPALDVEFVIAWCSLLYIVVVVGLWVKCVFVVRLCYTLNFGGRFWGLALKNVACGWVCYSSFTRTKTWKQ